MPRLPSLLVGQMIPLGWHLQKCQSWEEALHGFSRQTGALGELPSQLLCCLPVWRRLLQRVRSRNIQPLFLACAVVAAGLLVVGLKL